MEVPMTPIPRPTAASPTRQARWAGALAIAAASLAMLRWSWLTWPDVLIDFGRELYVPWQIFEGKTLYTDIAYFNGPLSPYLNSLWFQLFGPSLRTLAVCNLVILAGVIALLHRLLREIADLTSATVACLMFVTLFAFGQLVGVGNYNYVCPYQHQVTHGLALSLLAIWSMSSYLARRRLAALAGAGLCLGLVFLTKAEIFLATVLSLTAGLALTLWTERPPGRGLIAALGLFAASAVMPVIVAWGLLSLAMPWHQALQGTLGAWPSIFNTHPASLRFYRMGMGTLDPLASVRDVLAWTGRYVLLFVPVAALALACRRPAMRATGVTVATLWTTGWLLGGLAGDWMHAFVPLPLVMLVAGAIVLVAFVRRRDDPRAGARLILCEILILWALVLLSKMILFAHVWHYGFVLAMPATLLMVVALVGWIPDWIGTRGGSSIVFRAAALSVLLIAIAAHLQTTRYWFRQKTYPLSRGADRFLADDRGVAIGIALAEIDRQLSPGETLAVLPEGAILNFLSRRSNPTPYHSFTPFELMVFGEARILSSFQAHPPDCIILVHRETSEEGPQFFGRDYGRGIDYWIRENYHPIVLIGAGALQAERAGILILHR